MNHFSNLIRRASYALLLAMPIAAMAAPAPQSHNFSPLVSKVRDATARYRDVNVAIQEGWVAATPCVSGPDHGAMGVHFVLPDRLSDGVVDADEPEALIYEPLTNGALRLVGVEFIALASTVTEPPKLEGHLLNFVGEPNRFGLPAFYEMHVWAWEGNPQGNFADWNTDVSCDHQPLDD
ncbi:MAG TPA: hypothetical protein VKB52_10790 [Rhodanobacteraceae bacterium]|nr:hypothetical protein [Rhodanobacteraceae bacterium]